jgi:hypothetical protein
LGFSVLLDDPEIALWANETCSRYRISCLEALSVLAHALVVDTSTVTRPGRWSEDMD